MNASLIRSLSHALELCRISVRAYLDDSAALYSNVTDPRGTAASGTIGILAGALRDETERIRGVHHRRTAAQAILSGRQTARSTAKLLLITR